MSRNKSENGFGFFGTWSLVLSRRRCQFNDVVYDALCGNIQFGEWAVEVTSGNEGIFLYLFFDPCNVILGGLNGRRVRAGSPEVIYSIVSVAELCAGGVSRQSNRNSVCSNNGPGFTVPGDQGEFSFTVGCAR